MSNRMERQSFFIYPEYAEKEGVVARRAQEAV